MPLNGRYAIEILRTAKSTDTWPCNDCNGPAPWVILSQKVSPVFANTPSMKVRLTKPREKTFHPLPVENYVGRASRAGGDSRK